MNWRARTGWPGSASTWWSATWPSPRLQVSAANLDDVHVASRLTAPAMDERMRDVSDLQVVDVRNPGEAAADRSSAVGIPVGQLPDRLAEFDPAKPTVVYCAGGYWSSVAASLLRQRGFGDVSDILGGYNA